MLFDLYKDALKMGKLRFEAGPLENQQTPLVPHELQTCKTCTVPRKIIWNPPKNAGLVDDFPFQTFFCSIFCRSFQSFHGATFSWDASVHDDPPNERLQPHRVLKPNLPSKGEVFSPTSPKLAQPWRGLAVFAQKHESVFLSFG